MRRRGAGTMLGKIAAAAGALALAAACGSSPTSPSTLPGGIVLTIEKTALAVGLQLAFNGQTFTTNTLASIQLGPGTYTLTGDFTPTGQAGGEGITFTFASNSNLFSGGVRAGSIVSVSGPVATALNCQISYRTPVATTAPQVFSLRFEVIADSSGLC